METVKPNFVCIGAQKAGTTTLADILSQHSDICIPPLKETKFFLFDEDYKKGEDYYAGFFTNYKGQKAVGEFDPDYLLFPHTAERIRETLGADVKIIVVLRNPADRAYSHYLMTKKKGLEPFPFEQAVIEEQHRKKDIKTKKIFAYIERGFYGSQLQAFLNVFPAKNFLFLIFEEDFLKNKAQTLKIVESFLGVGNETLPIDLHSNEAGEAKNEALRDLVRKPNFVKTVLKSIMPSKAFRKNIRKFFISKNQQKVTVPKLTEAQRKELIAQYFIDDIHLTETLINRNLGVWYK